MVPAVTVGLASAYDLAVPGGVGNQVLGLARHLHAAGHEVTVLAPGTPVDLGWGQRSLSAGRVVAVTANGSVARIAPVVSHRFVAAWSGTVDVVHLHEPLAPGLPQAVLLASRRPVVATVHAQADTIAVRVAGPLLRSRLRRAAVLSAVSEHARRTVRDHVGLDAVVVGNGVDVPPSAPPQPSGGPPLVVVVARLDEPRKGIDVLLAAWPTIHARHPAACLVLVGAGRPRGMRSGSAPAGVELAGRVDDATRTVLLDAADVVVAPHRGGESFGLVVAEAMARGRCLVASALPAFVDLLGERAPGERAGLVVAPGDPAQLAEAVSRALADPGLRARLGTVAWQRVTAHAWPVVAERWFDAYRPALALPPDPPTRRLLAWRL